MRGAAEGAAGGGGAEARSSLGPRLSSIARLLGHHVRQQPSHRDSFGRALPLSVSARTLAGIGDERSTEPRGSTARCERRLQLGRGAGRAGVREAAAACDGCGGGGAEAKPLKEREEEEEEDGGAGSGSESDGDY